MIDHTKVKTKNDLVTELWNHVIYWHEKSHNYQPKKLCKESFELGLAIGKHDGYLDVHKFLNSFKFTSDIRRLVR